MRSKIIAAALGSMFVALPVHARDCDDLRGAWTTNLKATVSFDSVDDASGQIVGRYSPASMPERAFPLTGFVNAHGKVEGARHYAVALTFAVSFQEFGGITSWSGICRMAKGENGDAPVIDTEDLIIAPMADYVWSHVIDNHDTLIPK